MLPDFVQPLLWDKDVRAFNVEHAASRELLFARIMERGGLEAMLWLQRSFGPEVPRDFVLRRGRQTLSPKSLSYWSVVTGADLVGRPGGGRPVWIADWE